VNRPTTVTHMASDEKACGGSSRRRLQVVFAHIARNDRAGRGSATRWHRNTRLSGSRLGRRRDDACRRTRFVKDGSDAATGRVVANPAAGDVLIVVVEGSTAHRAAAGQTHNANDQRKRPEPAHSSILPWNEISARRESGPARQRIRPHYRPVLTGTFKQSLSVAAILRH
jgi:hypothetical protein